MTDPDRAHFRLLLTTLAADLDALLGQVDAADDSISPDKAIGRLTRMEAMQAQAMSAAGRVRLKQRRARIDRALDALDRGDYGTCVQCSDTIPHGRLEIMPETRLCVACAARR